MLKERKTTSFLGRAYATEGQEEIQQKARKKG